MTRRLLAVALLASSSLAAPSASAGAQAPWQPALDLYRAASYEEALQALDALDRSALDPDGVVAVEQHRMLCLMALGRVAGAERAAEALLVARPAFVLAAHDVSPRVRTVFDATRRRVLPGLARQTYAEARRAYDAGEHERARDGFARLEAMLAHAPVGANDPSLDDLRTLSEGFRQLSIAAIERAETAPGVSAPGGATAAAPAAVAAVPRIEARPFAQDVTLAAAVHPAAPFESDPAPTAAAPGDDGPPSGHAATAAVAAPTVAEVPPGATPSSPAANRDPAAAPVSPPFTPIDIFTYDWRDKDVVPPTPLAQPISGWWGSMGAPAPGTRLGVVNVVIDEQGRVVEADVYQSVNRVYDAVLLGSVKQWRYQPATRGGRPVKYRRLTSVVSNR